MTLLAQIEDNEVKQVIVCKSIQWAEQRLGGTWIETKIDDAQEAYAGIGMGYDPNATARFARPWTQPPNESPYQPGQWVWHGDRLWQCIAANNVWTPGEFGWRDHTDGNIPRWVQPAGAGDQYRLNDQVMHKSKLWKSNNDANVWEPGGAGIGSNIWEDITVTTGPDPGPQPWVQPTGAHDAYNIGAIVTYNGQTWRSTVNANVWAPGVFGWVVV